MRNEVIFSIGFLFLFCTGCGRSDAQVCSSNGYTLKAELVNASAVVKKREKQLVEMGYTPDDVTEKLAELSEGLKSSYTFRIYLGATDSEERTTSGSSDPVFGGTESAADYSKKLHQLLFGLAESITLIDGHGKSYPPEAYHLERTFGLTAGRAIMVSFPRENIESSAKREITLQVENAGPVAQRCSFRFRG